MEQTISEGYLVNPPMVHCVDMMYSTVSVVCGLGDGSITVRSLMGKSLELVCSASLHSTAVSQVRCVEADTSGGEKRSLIVSGGNDGKVVISELTSKAASTKRGTKKTKTASPMTIKTLARVKHASKVNWIGVQSCGIPSSVTEGASAAVTDKCYRVYVADQSCFISVYQFEL